MTNFEFYKKDLQKLNEQSQSGFALVNGRIMDCEMIGCQVCAFNNHCSESVKLAWLLAEHIEKPKLTKAERAFCENARTGFIARDACGRIYLFISKPLKYETMWGQELKYGLDIDRFFTVKFDFIKWEDTEPWSIESLLELEVEA